MKNTYYVWNINGDIAGHDLTYEEAEAVLERELENDKENELEREILDTEDKEDLY